MNIAVDFDDTIIDLFKEIIKTLNKQNGCNIEFNKLTSWNIKKAGYNISKEDILGAAYSINPIVCDPCDKNVAKWFNKLAKKHRLEIVTSRPDTPLFWDSVYLVLEKLGLWNWFDIVLVGRKNKQDYGYDLYIDDNPNLARGILNMDTKIPSMVLYDRPWNWSFECEKYPNIIRATNWKQVYKAVEELASTKNDSRNCW